MSADNALAIMVKAPEPGRVKTRLTPPLSPEEAAGLYRCLVKDFFNNIKALEEVDVFAAFAPPNVKREISDMVPPGVSYFPQEGRSLGDKIYNVFKWLFKKGYKKVVVTGSDSPDLPVELINEALTLLSDNTDLVLGPAKDGGYYLVAMKQLSRAPFTGIPWSTEGVLSATLEKASVSKISTGLLRTWHDIDCNNDLKLLRNNKKTPASSGFLRALKHLPH